MLPMKFSWRIFFTTVILGIGIVFPLEIAYASFISSSINPKNSISSGYWITPTVVSLPTATLTPEPTATTEPTVTETPTPTETLTPTPEITLMPLVINEVSPLGDSTVEWIELYNPNQLPVDISGWKISDNSGTDIIPPVSSIQGLNYGVIVGNASVVVVPFSATRIQLATSTIGSGLNNTGGDQVVLSNPSDIIIDQMSYGNVAVFPSPPHIPATGKTLSRIPNGVDTDSGTDWSNSTDPSIGADNI